MHPNHPSLKNLEHFVFASLIQLSLVIFLSTRVGGDKEGTFDNHVPSLPPKFQPAYEDQDINAVPPAVNVSSGALR
jgi:hypothetical protein